ncbi:hypothetical protein EZV62_024057 [Acer yangbiense]|uniref:Uncharacterized protein n=1 Tax=Acer yangbiense TaxID=1000413 RepID=A0A5C7H3F7_9ROSI|nr:hypothetical protein EZV62_024057 [Acer yangbiense]
MKKKGITEKPNESTAMSRKAYRSGKKPLVKKKQKQTSGRKTNLKVSPSNIIPVKSDEEFNSSVSERAGYNFTLANHGGIRGWNVTSPGPVDSILSRKEILYTRIENLKILTGTWNVGQGRAFHDSLISWLGSAASDGIFVVVGLQEVEMVAGVLAMSAAKETVGLEGSSVGQWLLDLIGKSLDEGSTFECGFSRLLAGLLVSVCFSNQGAHGLRLRVYDRVMLDILKMLIVQLRALTISGLPLVLSVAAGASSSVQMELIILLQYQLFSPQLSTWERSEFRVPIVFSLKLSANQLELADCGDSTAEMIKHVISGYFSQRSGLQNSDTQDKILDNYAEKVGPDIVKRAPSYQLKLIAKNASVNGSVVSEKVFSSDNPKYGYNAATGIYKDLMAAGIIDPTKWKKLHDTCLRTAAKGEVVE